MEPIPNPSTSRRAAASKGVALVIVLCLLVLISGIVVAFFSSVSSEYLTAKSASSGASGKELADAAVQLVMGQIRQATSQGSNICWASQPGMIRTWGNSDGSASFQKLGFYKLYSSGTMVVKASIGSFKPEDDIPATTWVDQPALYTDLNAPVAGSTGTTTYPIVDPRAADVVSGTNSLVEGFSIITSTNSGGYAAPIASGANANQAPMPVKWIYVLRDGTMIVPDSFSTGTSATFASGTNIPTVTNPIVGRVAFWSDDETCKLNINTACGGSPWDQPMFNSGIESAFSRYQPAAHDYVRYPGHPAGTFLSPVFWSFSSMPSPDYSLASNPTQPGGSGASGAWGSWGDWAPRLGDAAKDYWQKTLRISPRNEFGDSTSVGTTGGSQMATVATAGCYVVGAGGATGVGYACPVDSDRLYASIDELMFTPARTGRADEQDHEFKIKRTDLQKMRFFLTANSRAAEVNLYNQPKVAIWPVPDLNNKSVANMSSVSGDTRSPSDKLIAFCSTLNSYPYYFTRYDATSAVNDFSSRNIALFNYLNRQLAKPIPGFGGVFSDRYGVNGTSQILTEIYDYIRSCVNIQDSSAGTDNDLLVDRLKWSYTVLPNPRNDNKKIGSAAPGQGQVVPFLHPTNGTKGLGHFPTIKQATIMFIARGANQPPLLVDSSGRPTIALSGTMTPSSALTGTNGDMTLYGLNAVLSCTVAATVNEMHPFSADGVSSQLSVAAPSGGTKIPVLAVNDGALTAAMQLPLSVERDQAIANAVYPLFKVDNAYPTLCKTSDGKEGYIKLIPSTSGTIVLSDNSSHPYYKAAKALVYSRVDGLPVNTGTVVIDDSTSFACKEQTHAGLNYLTIPRISGTSAIGAYDLPNPRYQITGNANTGQIALKPHHTQVQAIFFIDPVNNAPGFTALYTDYQVRIQGLDQFRVDDIPMEFTANATEVAQYRGGNTPLGGGSLYDIGALTHTGLRRNVALAANANAATKSTQLNFYSRPKVAGSQSLASQGSTFVFTGNDSLVIDLLTSATTSGQKVQTYNIKFPSGTFPTPKLPFLPSFACGSGGGGGSGVDKPYRIIVSSTNTVNYPPATVADLTPSSVLTFTNVAWNGTSTVTGTDVLSSNPNYGVFNAGTSGTMYTLNLTRNYSGSYNGAGMELVLPERDVAPSAMGDYKYKLTADTLRSVECLYGDTRVIAALKAVPSEFFAKHKYYDDMTMRSAHSIFAASWSGIYMDAGKGTLSQLRGATCSYLTDITPKLNDPKTSYIGWNNYAGSYGQSTWGYPTTAPDKIRSLLGSSTSVSGGWSPLCTSGFPHVTSSADLADITSIYYDTFKAIWATAGDYDNGPNYNPDGPYINKAPETTAREDPNRQTVVPDFNCGFDGNSVGDSLFSPNRQIASAVMFGSLPAGFSPAFNPASPTLSAITPWRSLLFCPNPNSQNHPSLGAVVQSGAVATDNKAPDFTILDLFQMPVVNPYAISEPFSTAGKVNMNYQIAPFTYLKRDTALRGVLRSVMVTAVDDMFIGRYKGSQNWFQFNDNGALDKERTNRGFWDFRYPVHPGATLQQFENRFGAGDLFHSASEICSLWLYPATQPTSTRPENPKDVVSTVGYSASALTAANIVNLKSWWYDNIGTTRKSLTGDNMRERPYDTLYPRLTTKSNSYTVHFRVQMLKQDTSTAAKCTTWTENSSRIISEYRGSSLIERYIDPNDPNLPDFAINTEETLDNYYKFRIVNTKKFTAE